MTGFKCVKVSVLLMLLGLSLSACNAGDNSPTSLENISVDDSINNPPIITPDSDQSTNTTDGDQSKLDSAEEAHLVFMREEEKLARDVYMTLSTLWPDARVLVNIGEGSEQTHTDVMRDKLADYGVDDPNPETNDLPSSIGYYTGEDYGVYFTEKYQLLVNSGSQSELDAMYVGAFIEELDMHDIVECPTVIVETDNGITDCGMNYTDEQPLINAYASLLDGSKNHLRAFVGRIENVIGEGNYKAQVISQEVVDAILDLPGGRHVLRLEQPFGLHKGLQRRVEQFLLVEVIALLALVGHM